MNTTTSQNVTPTEGAARSWLGRRVRQFRAFLKDPHRIQRDWADFNSMTDAERREEYDRLLNESPTSDRFRRLNHHIAVRWVYKANT